MFSPQFLCRLVCLCLLLCNVGSAAKKGKPLDRTLDKLASAMLHAYPELKEGKRTRMAHAALVSEFKRLKADSIPEVQYRKLKRRKADFTDFQWIQIVSKFERAQLTDPKCAFLLKKAKREKMSRVDQYVTTHLMEAYFKEQIAIRERLSKSRLRAVGKAYTIYLKLNKTEPARLNDFVLIKDNRMAVNPLTGDTEEWIYVGAGPAFIKGSNNYRVVAYSPFGVGMGEDFRLVGYKGGRNSEWKQHVVLKKYDKMQLDIMRSLEDERLEKQRIKRNAVAKESGRKAIPVQEKESTNLKITIRELW